MPLNVAPKVQSSNSNIQSRVVSKAEVSMGKPSATTSRVAALKQRLSGPRGEPIANRPANSSARQEQMQALKKFTVSPAVQAKPLPPPGASRRSDVDLSNIPPPPTSQVNQQINEQLAQKPLDTGTHAAPEVTKEAPQSPQFVALARKERQLRKAQQEFKSAQEAWKQDQAKFLSRESLLSDPLKALAEAGITPDKLVELQLRQAETADPNQPLLDKISQLEKQLKDLTDPETGTLAQRDKQAYDQAVSQIRSDVKLLVDSDPAYGTIKSEGNSEEVVKLITSVFDEEGIILDVEEAAKLIEDKLVDLETKRVERLMKLSKFKDRFGKQAEVPAEASSPKQPARQISTLTTQGAVERPLTPYERAVRIAQQVIETRKGR